MQPISRNIHIFYGLGGIQGRQLHSQFLGVICLNSFGAAALVEFFKTFVLEGLNHLVSVACCATPVKPHNALPRGGEPSRSGRARVRQLVI